MDQVYKKLVEELNTYEELNNIKEAMMTVYNRKVNILFDGNGLTIKKDTLNNIIVALLQRQKEICDDLIHTLNKMNKEK